MVWTCLFTCSPLEGHLDFFPPGSCLIRIELLKAFFYTDFCANTDFISLEKIPKGEIPDSYARFFFSFFFFF